MLSALIRILSVSFFNHTVFSGLRLSRSIDLRINKGAPRSAFDVYQKITISSPHFNKCYGMRARKVSNLWQDKPNQDLSLRILVEYTNIQKGCVT